MAGTLLVVGGTGSVGGAVVRRAAAGGWRVVAQGRTAASAAALRAGLGELAERVEMLTFEVRESADAAKLVAAAAERTGRLDGVVDCLAAGPAGAHLTGRFAATDPAAYGAFLALSLAFSQTLAWAALPWLAATGGSLLFFGSDAARFAAPGQALVGAARAGLVGFVRNLAVEVASQGVRANCILLTYLADSRSARRLSPAQAARMARAAERAGLGLPTADDVAPLALFLLGPGAAKITGQVISINGGLNA